MKALLIVLLEPAGSSAQQTANHHMTPASHRSPPANRRSLVGSIWAIVGAPAWAVASTPIAAS